MKLMQKFDIFLKTQNFASISNNINPYDYEINLNSTKDDSKQELNIESLSVGLDDQGIYLWSEDLHRKVKPKFTNAINGLAVKNKMYRFLFFLLEKDTKILSQFYQSI